MSKKYLSVFLITALLLASLSGCAAVEDKAEDGRVAVAVSFNPMAELAKAVGGDKIDIYTIVPDGAEPHDFELKAKDIQAISKAEIFVYNGAGMESWAQAAVAASENSTLIEVDASKGCDLITTGGVVDPHVWLSLKMAKVQAQSIKDALVQADPDNREYYEGNYSVFSSEIDELYDEYKAKFDALQSKNFVTGHAAFAYFCRDFGLRQSSVEDVFAEGEPTARKIAELVQYCRENNVDTIFMEELASPKVSETLAKEIGAKVERIYTLESSEGNDSYLGGMRKNLSLVYESLR
ncbi:MAG TPA: metal ABC transporter substrate-binding protein [Clostridiaceae bacterium]|nr:metal ABC transporter substrate-binding protein [Clostridiaceae bacterium]